MDGYSRLRAATTALSTDELRDCVECLVLGLYGSEDTDGHVVLSTDRDWSDDAIDEVMQFLDDYGLHPDVLNSTTSAPERTPSRRTRHRPLHGRASTMHLSLVRNARE